MKFSEAGLRRWVNPPVTTEALAHQLTMAGLEVDAIEAVAPPFSGIVVGRVVEVAPHPDADKLRVCQVDVAQAALLTIVCGAPNVHAGMVAPVALIGAELPGGLKIKRSKLRGVVSEGMLCSASELGLSEERSGLMALPVDLPLGVDLRQALELDDHTIELGLTPNRGDCLSLAGIAREVGVIYPLAVTPPAFDPVAVTLAETPAVTVTAPHGCPRYLGRIVRGLNRQAATPLWMVEQLRRSGLRSLGPLVDVTNWVMLELGQPMHAFALNRLHLPLQVRMAAAGESLTLLNGTPLTLQPDTLVIADQQRAVALAGIMGGADSAVAEETTDILLESAFFAPEIVAGRARRYGLHTDSSHRFERGVDPTLQRHALERATALLLSICGGTAGAVQEVVSEPHLPPAITLTLRQARLEQILGLAPEPSRVVAILERLGLTVTATEGGYRAEVPPFRFDLTAEVDLIEEIGRVIGYDQLPSRPLTAATTLPPLPEQQLYRHHFADRLVERGYSEAITYSFIAPDLQQLLEPQIAPLTLKNPISADMAAMRTTLWGGLLMALQHNLNRQQDRVRLFESGLCFTPQADGTLLQEERLAAVLYGPNWPEQWGATTRKGDFFDLKGDLEALLALTGEPDAFRFTATASHSALHPGQAATIEFKGQSIGQLGMLHPALSQKLDLPKAIYLFELKLAPLNQRRLPRFSELSRFPAVHRDLAFVVADRVHAADLLTAARQIVPAWVTELALFDLYAGENLGQGRKSLAIRLTLQAESKTLTDDEVDTVIDAMVQHLQQLFSAQIRD